MKTKPSQATKKQTKKSKVKPKKSTVDYSLPAHLRPGSEGDMEPFMRYFRD